MPQTCRVNDIGVGICCCHSHPKCRGQVGIVITCSGTVYGDSRGIARVSDIVMAGCGHIGVLVSGSGTTFHDNLAEVRTGDQFVGCFTGIMVTGSPTIITDG